MLNFSKPFFFEKKLNMEKVIYFIRHGQTDYNLKRIIQGSGIDSDLNETGREQGGLFFEQYKNIPFEVVMTSTLKRTHQTVAHFIDAGIPWEQYEEIVEMHPQPARDVGVVEVLYWDRYG